MPRVKDRIRICKQCNKEFEVRTNGGTIYYCSSKCRNKWHSKNSAIVYRSKPGMKLIQREKRLIKKFGITLEDFEKKLAKQNYQCAICRTTNPGGYNWHIDHDHNTGKVRGILCSGCNQGLGCFKENLENLSRAREYLNYYDPSNSFQND